MFFQNLSTTLALVIVCGLAGFTPAIVPAARSATVQETAIGPHAAVALARMGKTLSAKQFSFQSRTFRSYVGPNGEFLHIAHATKTIFSRRDTRTTPSPTTKLLVDRLTRQTRSTVPTSIE